MSSIEDLIGNKFAWQVRNNACGDLFNGWAINLTKKLFVVVTETCVFSSLIMLCRKTSRKAKNDLLMIQYVSSLVFLPIRGMKNELFGFT